MASQKPAAKSVAADREFTLSQKQYDLILNFLKNGVVPTLREIKDADLEGNLHGTKSRKVGKLSNFKCIAKRLKYRALDNSLTFYVNSKIVLPNTKFVDVIKKVHRCKGEKHLNFTKTFEKLSEKYCMGLRQFGITEEKVREVVRGCQEGSCSKYYKMTPTKLVQEPFMLTSSTTPALTMPRPINPMLLAGTNQPLQPVAIRNQSGQACIAVPCFFRMPNASVSKTPGSLPKKPFLLYAGSCGTKTPGTCSSTSVAMVTQPAIMPVQTPQGLVATNAMFIPSPVANMPNLAQLLAINPLHSLAQGQGLLGHGQGLLAQGQQLQGQGLVRSIAQSSLNGPTCSGEGSRVSVTVYNPAVNTAASAPGGSASLTNISATVGSMSVETSPDTVDENNNLGQQHGGEKDMIVIDPLAGAVETGINVDVSSCDNLEACKESQEDTGSTQSKQSLPSSVEEDPLYQIVASIHDMRHDVFKAMAGSTQAPDLLKRKISFVEQMITAMKQYTEVYAAEIELDEPLRDDP